MAVIWLSCVLAPALVQRVGPAPALVQRVGRLASGGSQSPLAQCPNPGCGALLKPARVTAHLRRCPAVLEQRELEASGYYFRDVNTGEALPGECGPLVLGDASAAELAALTAQVHSGHAACFGSRLAHTPPIPADTPRTTWTGSKHELARERHRVQRRAIVDELAALGALGRGHCIIELGAGNGELSLAMAETHPAMVRTDTIILLDQRGKPRGRQGHNRHAADAALRTRCASFTRVKVGLQHVDLAALRDKHAPGRRIVVLAKHLCGAASDYALRAVAAASREPQPPVALVLGTCCHQHISRRAYPNRAYLEGALGLSARQFQLLCRLSSHGVSEGGVREGGVRQSANDTHLKRPAEGGSRAAARADTGRRAKDLLDEGRAAFLRTQGFDARLCTYVDASVTPENVLIVAQEGRSTVSA